MLKSAMIDIPLEPLTMGSTATTVLYIPISIKYQHIPRTRTSIAPISALLGLVNNQSR